MENAWAERAVANLSSNLNKLRGDLPSPKIFRLLGGWSIAAKNAKKCWICWNTVLTTGCCLQLDDNCPGCLILPSGKIWDVDRYMTGVATVDKHIWKNTFPVSSVQIDDLFFHQHSVYWNDFQYIRLSQHWKRLGSILDNNSSHMFTVISRFHKKKLASKASKLKTPPPTRATRKDLQLPAAARILKFNSQKNEQLLKKVILGSPCTREILSVSVQSASVLACSEPRSTKTAAADNSKGNWLRYLLFRSRLQQNQIAESFRNPNRIKGLPGMPSCRIQAWSTIIQVYLDLSPQVTIVVTTWDY